MFDLNNGKYMRDFMLKLFKCFCMDNWMNQLINLSIDRKYHNIKRVGLLY